MPRKSCETMAIPTMPANLRRAWIVAAGARDEDRDHDGGQDGERGMKHAEAEEEVAAGREILGHGGVRKEGVAEGGDDAGGGGDEEHCECRRAASHAPFSSSAVCGFDGKPEGGDGDGGEQQHGVGGMDGKRDGAGDGSVLRDQFEFHQRGAEEGLAEHEKRGDDGGDTGRMFLRQRASSRRRRVRGPELRRCRWRRDGKIRSGFRGARHGG